MTIEERICRLEQGLSVPGTQIVRHLKPKEGIGWSLAIGGMMEPKDFFYGDTIEEVLALAERELIGEGR